jgi:hypothetical protein
MADLRPYLFYEDRDDRWHPQETEFHYEWWYSDFRFDNGWSAVAAWHYSDWLKKPRAPSVELSIYDPDGNRYYEETVVKAGQAVASEKKCDVLIGGHHFWQEGNEYRLVVNSGKVGADLTLQRVAPAMMLPSSGSIYYDETSGDAHFWCVSIPRGNAFGKLIIAGKEIPVRGVCYHDHNWGTCDMNQNFGGWVWGRFFDDVYSGIFTTAYPLTPLPLTGILYLAKRGELVMMTDGAEIITLKEGFDEPSGITNSVKFMVKGQEENCEFEAIMEVQRIIERDHLKFSGWKTHNWRFLDNYEATITVDGVTDTVKGQTIHERFLLRLK